MSSITCTIQCILEEIMADIQNNHTSSISIGGLPISNLIFADDIDLIAGNTQELQALTDKLSNNASKYGMEISIEKSKVIINMQIYISLRM